MIAMNNTDWVKIHGRFTKQVYNSIYKNGTLINNKEQLINKKDERKTIFNL